LTKNGQEIAKCQVLDGHKFVVKEYYYVSPTAQSAHLENAIRSGHSRLCYCHCPAFGL